MEDSFRVRADKIFGKLDTAVPGDKTTAPPVTSSLWCLKEEVERRKWNRRTQEKDNEQEEEEDNDEEKESNLKDTLESDLQDLSDCDDEEEGGKMKRCRNSGADDDVWDVQSNIGRDRTLDFEEEEDEFDKVAVGSDDQTGDRLYMKDVKVADYDIDDLDTYTELPSSFRAVEKDPRANHSAAKMRLKEDAEASGTLDTSVSENGATSMDAEDSNREELNANLPKPILKKGEKVTDSRPNKRVRFQCEPKTESEGQHTSGPSDLSSDPSKHNGAVEQQHASDLYSPGIPDYLRNPSKYTRYAFDSTEETDEQSNKKAFMEFFQSLKQRSNNPDDAPVDISKPVMFTPRTKSEDVSIAKGGQKTTVDSNTCSIGVVEEDIQESEVSAMEEDKPPLAVESGSSMQKPGRKYRARTTSDDDSTNL